MREKAFSLSITDSRVLQNVLTANTQCSPVKDIIISKKKKMKMELILPVT